MSMIFGEWTPERKREATDLEAIQQLLGAYAPDSCGKYERPELTMLHCGLHATPESAKEIQPMVTRQGTVLAWTGRLDNRAELIAATGGALREEVPDSTIVAAAYSRFGIECLPKLIGDWTLSVWDALNKTLLLARDPLGVCPLYFAKSSNSVRWSNALDALMLQEDRALELNEAYIAGWLLSFPAADQTPYRGISAVPPGSVVRFYRGAVFVSRYWRFSGAHSIRYRDDRDYEEHFRRLFRQAIARRLRAAGPVLAELSGGIDSSSIVCMADRHLNEAGCDPGILQTISYFDDDEPNWDERKNFGRIEALRGRQGFHIDCREHYATIFDLQSDRPAPIPSCVARGSAQLQRILKELSETQGWRVLLSGIGGDEVLGGVPTPYPELEDLLVGFRARAFVRQLRRWSAVTRRSALTLVSGTLSRFLPGYNSRHAHPYQVPWLDPEFRRRNAEVLQSEHSPIRLWGDRPSFQENLDTLSTLQRQLASQPLAWEPAYEKRYPYLDRDLLEFLFAIPREQILRPGERRSLMRRALAGMVPPEVLFQKRKAAAVRGPVRAAVAAAERMLGSSEPLEVCRRGFVVRAGVVQALARLKSGESIEIVPVIRVLALEGWLQNLGRHGILEVLRTPPEKTVSRCAEDEAQPVRVS